MGNSTQKQYDAMMQLMQSYINKATAPSPYETQSQGDYTNIKNWLSGRDFRDSSSVGIDMLPLSEYHKQRQMLRGTDMKKPSQTLVNQRELADNQFDENYSDQYQNAVGGLENKALGLTSSLQNLYSNRMNSGLNGSQSMLTGINNRPAGFNWLNLITQGLSGLGNIAPAFQGSGGGGSTPFGGGFSLPNNGLTLGHEAGNSF